MNNISKVLYLALIFSVVVSLPTYGKVERVDCGELVTIKIKNNAIDFSSELSSVTIKNLECAINKANKKIDRRDDILDPAIAGNLISHLKGVSLLRLDSSDINCAIGVDNSKNRLVIIDSKNEIVKDLKICGPMVRRKKRFPWFKITWECATLWKYSFSKLGIFGESGTANGQFSYPSNIASCAGKKSSDPFDLWIPDSRNNRIAHLRYSLGGNMQWVNSIGTFYHPIDIACRFDIETPSLYVAEEKGGLIVRVPFSDENISFYQGMEGQLQEGGIDIGKAGGFGRPTGVCLNRGTDNDGWENSITYVYVADAGNEKIYRFMEAGAYLQYMDSADLPPLKEPRSHVGIRSDRFGTIYVFDCDAGKVRVYSQGLEPLSEFGSPGDHSSTDIKFNYPSTGFITSDNLFVIDRWGGNSGLQRFNIGGIEIVSAAVDYAGKTATILADNAFNLCTYSIDGDTPAVEVPGLQFSGSFTLQLDTALAGLSPGRHTLTVTLRSAFSTDTDIKADTATVGFIVDPNADRQPRNIKIATMGRRIDISWDAPPVTAGLSGYAVYVNGNRVYDCDAETFSYSYYASREQAGATFDIKLGAIFEQPVSFSGETNFTVIDGNSLEHDSGTGEASANSVQQLSQADWDALTMGTAWTVNATLDTNPDALNAVPMISIVNSPVMVDLLMFYGPCYRFTGAGGVQWYDAMKGDRIRMLLLKKGSMSFDFKFCITGNDGKTYSIQTGSAAIDSFPLYVYYHSDKPGLKLSNCTIGLENAMSSSISVTLRASGDVTIDGSGITLDDAVTTAFNGDNLLLSDAQYTLSVPLNYIPAGDLNVTPVGYTISLNSSIASGEHAEISYSGPENIIKVNAANIQTSFSISGAVIKSNHPISLFSGSSDISDCDVSLTMQNCVIDAPAIRLIDNSSGKPIPDSGTIAFDISSSTLVMDGTGGFITLHDSAGVTLSMSDNLIYQKDFSSCFCFADTGAIDVCGLPNVGMTGNSFLLAQMCAGCDSICSPGQNEIVSITQDIPYLGSDYGVTNINNPGITRNGTTGEVEEIRGAIKTVDGTAIDSITDPKLLAWPAMLVRPATNSAVDQCLYLPLAGRSKVNISMNSRGTLYSSDDLLFTSPEMYTMRDNNDYQSKEMFPGEIFYAYGENGFGLRTLKYAFSFPGSVVFDEHAIGCFYGAADSLPDAFIGDTSADAASGAISWQVASLPFGGNPADGYERQRSESFYEPLPEVTGYESLSFYYKKQYADQQFSLAFQDSNGVTHIVQNTPLPTGTRGWHLTSDSATLDWQQAVILLRDEANLDSAELPLSGKLMRLTVSHQSASADTTAPVWMLFDNIAFQPLNTLMFDEQDPSVFTGTGGSDGWDGLTAADAFTGTKSFKIVIEAGNTASSDEWTGLSSGVDLPISSNKRKFTFAYKKSDPNSHASIKLHIQNPDTNIVTVFEITELDTPGNPAGSGWPIPRQDDTCWHRVFIDLFSVRGPGDTVWSDSSRMPFGKCAKIELCLNGAAGSHCLFDNIKFIQDFYRQTAGIDEYYTVSPDYSENAGTTGWKINALGEVAKNTIISYGPSNNIAIEENYNLDGEPSANMALQNYFEIEKPVSVSGSDFPDASIYWREKGTPIGYIELAVGCSDGNTYPLAFSPTGYSLNNSRGVFNFKSRSDLSETKHFYKIANEFNSCYPELVNADTPVTPINVSGMKVLYRALKITDRYTQFEYPEISFPLQDTTPLALTVTHPVDLEHYGNTLPIELTANKEIGLVEITAKNGGYNIEKWEYPVMTAGQTSFTGSCDLRPINRYQLGPDGEATVTLMVTDIFGEAVTESLTIYIDRTVPSVSLRKPVNQAAYNGIVPLDGFSDIPLESVTYQIVDADGYPVKTGDFVFSGDTTEFRDSITIDDADRFQTVTLQVYGTTGNGMNSPLVDRTILLNPLGTQIVIGPVTNPGITWDSIQTEATLCGASAGTGGTQDTLLFYPAQVFGNFEATVGITGFAPSISSAKAGLMARSELTVGSVSDFLFTSDSGIFLEYRRTTGQTAVETAISSPTAGTIRLKLKRVGADLTCYTSTDGLIFTEAYTRTVGTLPLHVGPAYTSGDASTEGCATFADISIVKLPDGTDEIALGITTATRVRPLVVQDGVAASVEDMSTRNGGEAICIGGMTYATGIGGMPQSDGAPSFLIYDLQSEASRLQVERFIRLTGTGSTQDGATAVLMQIKAANTTAMPSLSEWLSPTGQVYVAWDKPQSTDPKSIDIDLTGVNWLGIFIAATPMYSTRHGVWGDLTMEYIGSERKSPVITADPESVTRLVGERAVFSVKAEGTLPLTYQWQKNHMNISGATSSSYMTVPVQLSSDGAVYRCVVTNDFGKEYSFDAILTVVDEPVDNVPEFAIVAREHLDIRDQVTVVGSTIMSNALLTVGNDANVTANILAVGNIAIGDRTEVNGNVFAGGSVSLGAGANVTDGTVAGGQSVSSVEIESHSVTYGTDDITVDSGVTWTVTPGDHRDLHASHYSTLRFGPGTYNFRKFILESNVTLIFELDGYERAIINVYDETRFGDWCDMSIDGTADMFAVQWYSNFAQEIPVYPDSRIVGQLIMPLGHLHVFSRSIVNGLCQAKQITIEPTGGVNYSRSCPSTNQKPVISVPATAAENPVTGAMTAMSVLAVDDGGEENLIYHWTAASVPTGAWVTFSKNNSNAAKNMIATFGASGTYTLRATAEDGYLYRDTSLVTVTVNQTLTAIAVSPSGVFIEPSATRQFSAIAKDQFGHDLSTQPAFTWSVNGGGTIGSSGLFTAGTTPGYFMVTAASGSIGATVSIAVTPTPVHQINCGAGASSPFTADQHYSGGTSRTVTNTINTTGVTNPAPQVVYKSERYGTMTYTLPGLVASAQYIVRLHFSELYWTSAGKRKFNVVINGTTVLWNYDIYAEAGGQYKAVVREFTATANSLGKIVINFNTVLDNATIEGIEIIRN
ncbi:MAG: immunoglobulin domain-containing protein [Chitinispirillaceae bacterium]|nr:immunoglobulin domain-containing protein [Chitinispirillaceae bacterium]